MSNSKLFQSILLLSAEEFKTLGKWLQSPWCNSNKKLYELYSILKSVYPDFEHHALTKQELFINLYPDKDYNDRWMRNILAEMNKQIERFLIHQQIKEEEDLQQILLAKEYEKRHASTRLFKLASRFQDRIAAKKNKSLEDYYYGCRINELLYYSTYANSFQISQAQLLSQADLYLNQFYLLGKWRHLAEFKEREKITKENYDNLIDTNLLDSIRNDSENLPAIKLYELKIKMPPHPSKIQFNKAQKTYFENFDVLPSTDQKAMYYYLLNTLTRMAQKKIDLQQNLFDFYLEGIQRKTLINNNILSSITFNNIVTLGNTLGNFEVVKTFIITYHSYLDKAVQEDAYTWGMAHMYYNQKELNRSIELLRFYTFKVHPFNLSGRVLLLQTYFEQLLEDTSYQDLIFTSCENFKKYIYRNKDLSSTLQTSYLNFTKYTIQCIDLFIYNKKDKKTINNLNSKIEKEPILQGKRWLKKIVSELKNR